MGFTPTYKEDSLSFYLGYVGFGQISNGSVDLHDLDFRTLPGHTGPEPPTSGDVGAIIMVLGAGPSGSNLVTKVASFISSTEVNLVDAAGTTPTPGIANVVLFRLVKVKEGSAELEESLTSQPSVMFTVEVTGPTVAPVEGQPFLVTSTDPDVGTDTYGAFMGGEVDDVDAPNIPGASNYIEYKCTCVSYQAICARRVMRGAQYSGQTMAQVATSLVSKLTADFVDLSTPAGPTINDFTVDDLAYVSDALDNLVQLASDDTTGYFWRTTPYRKIVIGTALGTTAPWHISYADLTDSNILVDVGHSRSREKLANQVYLKDSQTLSDPPTTYTFKWTGASRFAGVLLPSTPAFAPTITVNAVSQIVDTIDASGLPAWQTTYQASTNRWAWVRGTASIVATASGGIPSGQLLVATYRTAFESLSLRTFDDGLAGFGVQARSAIQGGSGLHESVVTLDKALMQSELDRQSSDLARRLGIVPSKVDIKTYRGGLKIGQQQFIRLSDIGVNETYLVASVKASVHDGLLLWEATAVYGSVMGDWRTSLISAITGNIPVGPGGSPSGSAPPAPDLFLSFNDPGGTELVPYNASLKAAGGTPGYTYAVIAGSLPPGLSLNTSSGLISGTPTTAGSYPFTAQVTDSAASVIITACLITVAVAVYPPPALLDFTVAISYFTTGDQRQYSFTLKVKPDATNEHYASDTVIRIVGSVAGKTVSFDYELRAPFTLDGSGYAEYDSDRFSLDNTSWAWSMTAETYNDRNAPSGSPITKTITAQVATISSVAIAETGTRVQKPVGGNTYTTITVTPTWSAGALPQKMAIWFSFNVGSGDTAVIQGVFYANAASINIEVFLRLGSGSNNFKAYVLASDYPLSSNPVSNASVVALGAVASNALTLQLGAPAATGATLAIYGPDGSSAPTTTNIYMGIGVNGPYAKVIFKITSPASYDDAYFYDWWVRWEDVSGNPINPGGVNNTSGYQHHFETGQGITQLHDLLINYPAVDGYLGIYVWGRSRNSTVDNPPFTGDAAAVLQQWPGGGTKYLLHVGLAPGGATQGVSQGTDRNTNPAVSILSDPSFEFSMVGVVVNAGSYTGPGFIPDWSLTYTSGSIEVINTGGSSGPNAVKITGPSTGVFQGRAITPGQVVYITSMVKSNNPGGTHNSVLSAIFLDSTGTPIGSPTVIGTASGSTPSWSTGPQGYVTAPANAATIQVKVQNNASEPSGGIWYWDDINVQFVQNQTAGGQTNTANPSSVGPSGSSLVSATLGSATSYFGLSQWEMDDGSSGYVRGFATTSAGQGGTLAGGNDSGKSFLIYSTFLNVDGFTVTNGGQVTEFAGLSSLGGLGLDPTVGLFESSIQSGAISAANLYAAGGNAPAGWYMVIFEFMCTTAAPAQNVAGEVLFKDPDTGLTITVQIATGNVSTQGNWAGGSAMFKHAGGAQIQCATATGGSLGAGRYIGRWILKRIV